MKRESIGLGPAGLLSDFLELIYPRFCVVCGKKLVQAEQFICMPCLVHLPRTGAHRRPGNAVEQLFYGRVPIEHGCAYFEFKKGSNYQKIVHALKYKGQKELGSYLGRRYAEELKLSHLFDDYDYLCPLPLHPHKQRQRGYNQSEYFARGLSAVLNIPVSTGNLIRTHHTATQTRKSRWERWENVQAVFDLCDPQVFDGKRLILVDDVVTTGATAEACAQSILARCRSTLSIVTIAAA